MTKRQWYIDAALILIVVVLGVLVVIRLTNGSQPEVEETQAQVEEGQVKTEEVANTESASLASEPAATPEVLIVGEDQDDAAFAAEFTLSDLEGNLVSLSDYLGKPVMINFWATWCPPCRAEMPLIQEFQDKFADSFVVLAVNGGETSSTVQSFATAQGFTLMFLLDTDFAVAELYQVRGFPTSVFIDANGVTRKVHIGELSEPLIVSYLQLIGISE